MHTYRHYLTLKVSRLAPHKLYISIAHEEQARTSTCKNHTPVVCISLLPQPLQAFSLDMMLISCLCSDDGRPIASSLTTIVVDATTSALLLRSSCTGSAHFAHITTISSISWPFLPSIYADWSAAPLLGGVAILEAHERVPRWCV